MVNLANRLMAVSSLVRAGSRLADVGTDHAHLPIFLSQTGKIVSAIATDINPGPLENAAGEISAHGVNNIELRLGNGLAPVKRGEADDIVIAGMGGENIASIIDSCQWCRYSSLNFVLQPMTKADILRRYLCENGFRIFKEICTVENAKHYCVISAGYDGIVRNCDAVFELIGTLGENSDEASLQYIHFLLEKQKAVLAELKKSADCGDKAAQLAGIIRKLEDIYNGYGKADI